MSCPLSTPLIITATLVCLGQMDDGRRTGFALSQTTKAEDRLATLSLDPLSDGGWHCRVKNLTCARQPKAPPAIARATTYHKVKALAERLKRISYWRRG